MKRRELVKIITDAGGVLVRDRGGHAVYRLPDNSVTTVTHSKEQTLNIVCGVRRAIRKAQAAMSVRP